MQPIIELALGLYFTATVFYALANQIYGTLPFLMLFQIGFLYTGLLSIFQQYTGENVMLKTPESREVVRCYTSARDVPAKDATGDGPHVGSRRMAARGSRGSCPSASSFVVHTVLLKDLLPAASAPHAARGGSECHPALGFFFALVGFFAFAYAYAKGYEGGSGAQEGMRFGVLVGILICCFGMIWDHMVWPVSLQLTVAWMVDYIVEFAIYGSIVGVIYKPVQNNRSRGHRDMIRRMIAARVPEGRRSASREAGR